MTKVTLRILAGLLVMLTPSLVLADLPAQKSAAGGVTVTVTPKNVMRGEKVWEFQVALDTHSQELSDDLVKAALLGDQAPLEWAGAAPGGHHRSGVLRFRAMEPYPPVLELRIARPGEAAPRSFRWQLQ